MVIFLSKVWVQISRCFLLFILVFGLWQLTHVLIYIHLAPDWLQHITRLVTPIICVVVSILFIKWQGSDFQEYGFWWPEPEKPEKYLFVSTLLVLAHVFITVFLPGSFMGFELLPPTPRIPLEIMVALLTGLASEIVFRGYILKNLTIAYGFLPALCISSIMFTLQKLPFPSLSTLSSIEIFTSIISLLLAGIFLGLLFQRTKTLVCPVTFHVALLLSYMVPFKAAVTAEYALVFEVIAYAFLTIALKFIVVYE